MIYERVGRCVCARALECVCVCVRACMTRYVHSDPRSSLFGTTPVFGPIRTGPIHDRSRRSGIPGQSVATDPPPPHESQLYVYRSALPGYVSCVLFAYFVLRTRRICPFPACVSLSLGTEYRRGCRCNPVLPPPSPLSRPTRSYPGGGEKKKVERSRLLSLLIYDSAFARDPETFVCRSPPPTLPPLCFCVRLWGRKGVGCTHRSVVWRHDA